MEAKKNNFLTNLLSTLLLLTCLVAGFFAYQTQTLVKELQEIRIQELKKQTPTPTPTVSPVGFSGYNQNGKRFTLDLSKECIQESGIVCKTDAFTLTIDPESSGMGALSKPKISQLKFGNYEWEKRLFIEKDREYATYGMTYMDNYYLIKVIFEPYSDNASAYFDRILSTFKFTDSESITSPVACTMEAKVCSDGTSVGRTGPNCEFAPCPTKAPQP